MARNPDASVRIIDFAPESLVELAGVTNTVDVTDRAGRLVGEVSLAQATLDALEQITTTIANWPADFPDAAVLAKLEAVRVLLDGTLDVQGTVAVSNFPASVEIANDSGNAIPISAAALPLPAGASTEATQLDVKRGISDYRTLLDYSTRLDGNPVYVGLNAQAAAQSDSTWTVMRLSYDASSRLTDKQVLTGAWSARTTLGWT